MATYGVGGIGKTWYLYNSEGKPEKGFQSEREARAYLNLKGYAPLPIQGCNTIEWWEPSTEDKSQ